MDSIVTTKFHDSEISKSEDFNYSANSPINALHALLQGMFADVANSFVLSGCSIEPTVPPSMNIVIKPGIMLSRVENKMLHVGEDIVVSVSDSSAVADRIDTLEVRYYTATIDKATRAFRDPATGTISYNDVDTKTLSSAEARVVPGEPGSGVAPNTESGWMKLAEILIPAGATQVVIQNIKPPTSQEDGTENSAWTAEKALTFSLGSVESIKNTLLAHIRNNITEQNAVHGIQQGHGNGFNADKVDGVESARMVFGTNNRACNVANDPNVVDKAGYYQGVGENYPSGTSIYTMIHIPAYSDQLYATQIACHGAFSHMYFRRCTGVNTWTSWEKVWNSGNDGTGSDLDADMVDGVQSSRIIFGDNFHATTKLTTGSLNDIMKSGYYLYNGATDYPETYGTGLLEHIHFSDNNNYAMQIAYIVYAGRTFTRRKNNGVWTDWTDEHAEETVWNDFYTGTAGDTIPKYSRIARVTIPTQWNYSVFKLIAAVDNCVAAGNTEEMELKVTIRQEAAFGTDPFVKMRAYNKTPTGMVNNFDFGYAIVQNTPNTIVDIYVRHLTAYTRVVGRLLIGSKMYTTQPRFYRGTEPMLDSVAGYVGVTNVQEWNTENDGINSGLDADIWRGVPRPTGLGENANGGIPIRTGANDVLVYCSRPGSVGFFSGTSCSNVPAVESGYWHIACIGGGDVASRAIYMAQKQCAPGKMYVGYRNIDAITWYKVWTEYNDGAGSGMDTDLFGGKAMSLFPYGNHTSGLFAYSSGSFSDLAVRTGFYIFFSTVTGLPSAQTFTGDILYYDTNNALARLVDYNGNVYINQRKSGAWEGFRKISTDEFKALIIDSSYDEVRFFGATQGTYSGLARLSDNSVIGILHGGMSQYMIAKKITVYPFSHEVATGNVVAATTYRDVRVVRLTDSSFATIDSTTGIIKAFSISGSTIASTGSTLTKTANNEYDMLEIADNAFLLVNRTAFTIEKITWSGTSFTSSALVNVSSLIDTTGMTNIFVSVLINGANPTIYLSGIGSGLKTRTAKLYGTTWTASDNTLPTNILGIIKSEYAYAEPNLEAYNCICWGFESGYTRARIFLDSSAGGYHITFTVISIDNNNVQYLGINTEDRLYKQKQAVLLKNRLVTIAGKTLHVQKLI